MFCALLGTWAWTQGPASANFYVAPNGKDSWSGKLPAPNANNTDGPFASVAKAQIAVQELSKRSDERRVGKEC